MRAAVYDRYGPPDVVRITDVPMPKVKSDEVLVRVRAAAVTIADSRIRAARFPRGMTAPAKLVFGVRRPRRSILGGTFSGVVESVGAKVTTFEVGDEVAGMAAVRMGAHAEFVSVAAKRLVPKPVNVSHEDAAGVMFGGSTALFYLREKASVEPGMSVLVNGASGAVGTNAVQLARHFGATVTGVTSGPNADLVRSLGADEIFDYELVHLDGVSDRFDIVLDAVGNLSPAVGRQLLNDNGVVLLVVADLADSLRAHGNVKTGPAPERAEDLELLLGLVSSGDLKVVIDRVVGLDEIVAAHERVDSGHKVGNLIVLP